MEKPPAEALSWEYDAPILTNVFVWWDMVRVFLLAAVVIEALGWLMTFLFEDDPFLIPLQVWALPLGIVAALFALVSLLMLNRFSMRFVLDAKGVRYEASRREETRGLYRALKGLSVIMFLFTGQVVGAPSPQGGDAIPWREVFKVTVHRRLRVITLSNNWRSVLRLYCPAELFAEITARTQEYSAQAAARRAKRARRHRYRSLRFYLAWIAGTIVATLACAAWPWAAYDHIERIALLNGAIVLAVGLSSSFWWSKLLTFAAIGASLWFLIRLALEAATPFKSMFGGASYTYTLDTPLLVVALLGGLALLTLGAARLALPELNT